MGGRQPFHLPRHRAHSRARMAAQAEHRRWCGPHPRLAARQPLGLRGARMKVGVLGLWHLGSVTAACMVDAGCTVVGCDSDAAVVAGLNEGRAPLFEPGLDALLAKGVAAGRLAFSTDGAGGVAAADVVLVTYDTTVVVDDTDYSRVTIRG